MSVLIKGMEMPKEGHLIVRIYANGEVCEPTECAGIWSKVATAIPVPPHGDLIERDAAYDKIAEQEGGYYMDMDGVDQGLSETPVVIPAEEDK